MQNLDIKYILDSTAFYEGLELRLRRFYTTPAILEEVKHLRSGMLDILIEEGRLQVIEPDPNYIKKARSLAEKSGDLPISDADISIIALALYLEDAQVITNDYSIINILENEGIKTIGKKIKIGKWIRYCTACKASYNSNHSICNICGNRLRRRLIRSKR